MDFLAPLSHLATTAAVLKKNFASPLTCVCNFRENGRLRGLYVRPQHEKALREALERGRELERLIVAAGRDLVMKTRESEDAD